MRRSKGTTHLAYVQKVCELSRRGDMNAVADIMKGYYRDREGNPWHRMYNDIQTYWNKENPKQDVAETLLLLREAVFGALDILSFGLISDISTPEVVTAMTSEASWNAGRRRVRNMCLDAADGLIAKGDVRYLMPTSLRRDDFAFLVPRVEEAQWEIFKKARPKVSRGKLDLSKLEESVLGSRFLREQMIMDTKLKADDPRIPAIIEAYDLQLVEIEVDQSTRIQPPAPTEQTTLNGEVVQEVEREKESPAKKRREAEVATPLMDFLEQPNSKTQRKATDARRKKSRRRQSK